MTPIFVKDLNPAFIKRHKEAFAVSTQKITYKKPEPTLAEVARFFSRWVPSNPVSEFRFDPDRRWRFDYAWPGQKIALEVEGGVWTGGRHTRGAGFIKDMEKYNRAAVLGWRVVRVVPSKLLTSETAMMVAQLHVRFADAA